MADIMTLREILRKSPEERKNLFQVSGLPDKNIDKVIIDGIVFADYSAFTFLMEKSFVKSPIRSGGGSIENLDSYAWFLAPHLKIDFSLMSIQSYRAVMKLIQSKSEFTVTCYDVVNDKDVTHKMYFATEQMPKLSSIAKAINGGDPWVELLGVQDYTIELIGTNTSYDKHTIQFNLNVPDRAEWGGGTVSLVEAPANLTVNFATSFSVDATNENASRKNVNQITFNGLYRFNSWAENPDGSGFRYLNDNVYLVTDNMTLYAVWDRSATTV